MKLFDVLLTKAKNDELGHFYIVETSAPEEEAFKHLESFAHDFIRDYYQKVEGHKQSLTHLMDHPDVFVMGNLQDTEDDDKIDKFFKVEEAETLSRFFEFKPVQGKRKFAVITEGHRINTTVANKWLKLFEEPQGNSTIFLLNPRGGQLLPTIHSRAIHLRLPVKKVEAEFSDWNEFVSDLKKMTLSQFLENYRNENLSYWVNALIRWESEEAEGMVPKDKLMNWLKTFQEMEVFHQPSATKWTLFHSFLTENVLPRVK